MDFTPRGALAGLTIFMSAAAPAGSLVSPDSRSHLAQTAQPETTAPPDTAIPPETPPTMEEPHQGDRWVFEVKDEISGDIKEGITHTITEATDKKIVIRVSSPSQPNQGIMVFDRKWNILENGYWKFSPNNCLGIVTPLKPGKEWDCGDVARNAKTGGTMRDYTRAKVIGKQDVTTKAGSFEAFRIALVKKETDPEIANISFSVSVDMLYAPAVGHFVKRHERTYNFGRLTSDSTMELVSYSRKP
jgi:hypothetical protein